MHSSVFVYAIGFIAQGFFSARMLIQWILSERAKKIVSPNLYWICSLVGSILLFAYGWMRDDFSIILGQLISYYIYIWNLNIKGVWKKLPRPVAWILALLPVVAVGTMLGEAEIFLRRFFHNSDVPLWLLIFGSAGHLARRQRHHRMLWHLPPRSCAGHRTVGRIHHLYTQHHHRKTAESKTRRSCRAGTRMTCPPPHNIRTL